MKTYPLESITLEQAMQKQFKLIDHISTVFEGHEVLGRGDLGVVPGFNQPITTHKVEQVLANFFDTEAAMLVRGAGTTAIRLALHATLPRAGNLFVHDAPIYPTTKVSLDMLGINVIRVNFNDQDELTRAAKQGNFQGALVQLTRQKPNDSYDSEAVIQIIKEYAPNVPIITDDNYAVLKIKKIGVEQGADLSCFSTFKILGPEGIGCIVGKSSYIENLRKENYSGGLQVQGFEALDVLKGMVYAPVALAISAQQTDEVAERLNKGEVTGVKEARVANAQSKVILVTFDAPIAAEVLHKAEKLGAAPNPVGAESKYEMVPMFYRVSGTFRAAIPDVERNTIRINPMRAGADTIIRILKEAMKK